MKFKEIICPYCNKLFEIDNAEGFDGIWTCPYCDENVFVENGKAFTQENSIEKILGK